MVRPARASSGGTGGRGSNRGGNRSIGTCCYSSRRYITSSGERREEWFNCQAWGKLAETSNQYLTKGKQVYVEGRLSSRTYQTQSGETRHSLDINVTDIQFPGQRSERSEQDTGPAPEEYQEADLPF